MRVWEPLGVQTPRRGYVRSKSDLEIPRFLRIRWNVPVARSRFPCLGIGVSLSSVGLSHVSWDPLACR